jgi:hypothetical protein
MLAHHRNGGLAWRTDAQQAQIQGCGLKAARTSRASCSLAT